MKSIAMHTILELMAKHGEEQATLSSSSPRHMALSQSNKMLEELAKYKNVAGLNTETSDQNWWSSKPSGGKRRVTCRYNGKLFPDLSVLSDKTHEAVKQNIEILKKIIQKMDDSNSVREKGCREISKKNTMK